MGKEVKIADFLEREFRAAKRSVIAGIVSVNDLKELEEHGKKLSREEKLAVSNFDCYRLQLLKTAADDEEFRKNYELLQVLANLRSYSEFLEKKYC